MFKILLVIFWPKNNITELLLLTSLGVLNKCRISYFPRFRNIIVRFKIKKIQPFWQNKVKPGNAGYADLTHCYNGLCLNSLLQYKHTFISIVIPAQHNNINRYYRKFTCKLYFADILENSIKLKVWVYCIRRG